MRAPPSLLRPGPLFPRAPQVPSLPSCSSGALALRMAPSCTLQGLRCTCTTRQLALVVGYARQAVADGRCGRRKPDGLSSACHRPHPSFSAHTAHKTAHSASQCRAHPRRQAKVGRMPRDYSHAPRPSRTRGAGRPDPNHQAPIPPPAGAPPSRNPQQTPPPALAGAGCPVSRPQGQSQSEFALAPLSAAHRFPTPRSTPIPHPPSEVGAADL